MSGGGGILSVLRRRHPALPLEELPEGRLVAEAQRFGHLLHGEGGVAQADFGFTHQQFAQEAAGRFAVLPFQLGGERVGRDAYLAGIPSHFVVFAAMLVGQMEEAGEEAVPRGGVGMEGRVRLAEDDVPALALPRAEQGLYQFAVQRPGVGGGEDGKQSVGQLVQGLHLPGLRVGKGLLYEVCPVAHHLGTEGGGGLHEELLADDEEAGAAHIALELQVVPFVRQQEVHQHRHIEADGFSVQRQLQFAFIELQEDVVVAPRIAHRQVEAAPADLRQGDVVAVGGQGQLPVSGQAGGQPFPYGLLQVLHFFFRI